MWMETYLQICEHPYEGILRDLIIICFTVFCWYVDIELISKMFTEYIKSSDFTVKCPLVMTTAF